MTSNKYTWIHYINVFLFLLFFILSGCGGPNKGEEGVVLTGIMLVIGGIVVAIILRPFFFIMEESENIKNKKMNQFLFVISIVCIIIILYNMDKIFAFIFKPLFNLIF